jgi:hypothetical protein
MKTFQVFVSHTTDVARFPLDRSFVQAALDAVGRAGMAPVDMRYFAAGDDSPADYCRRRVRECEIYVAVIGLQYGTHVPDEQISYTELEFLAAGEADLPRLVFLLDEPACPPGLADTDRTAIDHFRQRLTDAGLIVRRFSSGHELELEIFHALSLHINKSPGGVPQIWNIPSRNADFSGRDGILQRLHDELSRAGTAVVTAKALYGLGGVGKTQVALEYAHRYGRDYGLVWWVPAEHIQGINLSLADLASRLGLPTTENPTRDALAALEQLRRETDRPWLIVFDNAEDPAEVKPLLPIGNGHVIITSRDHAWNSHAEPIQLDAFSRQESIAHLIEHTPRLSTSDAETISSIVGDLPLAIEQVAAWLGETGMPINNYIELLKKEITHTLSLSDSLGYAASVAAIWNMSFERLNMRSPAALYLLKILAFCSPEAISLEFLYSDSMNSFLLPHDKSLHNKFMLGPVMSEISHLGLARVDPNRNFLQIHRLVQAVIRSRMSDDEQRLIKHEVHSMLSAARPLEGDPDDPANWPAYALIFPHLISSEAETCDDSRTRQLALDWLRYQWRLGDYGSALILANRLRDLWTQNLGPNHQQTLQLTFQTANVLRSMGRFGDAYNLDIETLGRQRNALGSQHIDSLRTIGSVGADLTALGDLKQAAQRFRDAYENLSSKFGTDHPRTITAAFNVAEALNRAGDPFAAFQLEQEMLVHCREVLGLDHPYTVEAMAELGRFTRETGEINESIDLIHSAYQDLRRVLGDEFAQTLRAGKSLAVSFRKAGKIEDASRLTAQIYSHSLRKYGRTATDTLSCALNLASDYLAEGRVYEAKLLIEQVRADYVNTVGKAHPFTLMADNNLSVCLRAQGEIEQANILSRRTLDAMRTRLGEDHPSTISSMVNFANCLADTGQQRDTYALERVAVTAFSEKLGPRHPDTLLARANHAITMRAMGHRRQARRQQIDVLAYFDRKLGAEHPRTILLKQWRRGALELEAHPI